LGEDSVQARGRIVKARREPEEEAAYARTEEVGNMLEVPDQCLRPGEAFDVGDEFGCLDV